MGFYFLGGLKVEMQAFRLINPVVGFVNLASQVRWIEINVHSLLNDGRLKIRGNRLIGKG